MGETVGLLAFGTVKTSDVIDWSGAESRRSSGGPWRSRFSWRVSLDIPGGRLRRFRVGLTLGLGEGKAEEAFSPLGEAGSSSSILTTSSFMAVAMG